MCGFVGIYHYGNLQDVDERSLVRMRDTMIHRGPDDCGIYVSPHRKLGLGHRRLSIIDLSPRGRQPMSDSEGKIWIVYNGEVYNFPELRKQLEGKYAFRSRTDTEVLIYLYKEYGKDMVHKLRGMFAFAIWDENKKELWLVRDRMGIKPLYYTFVNGTIIFGSEIKALLKYPDVKREMNEEGFYHYLSFLTVPPPETLFKGIHKLPGGHMLTIKENYIGQLQQYWDVLENMNPVYEKKESFYTEKILELLDESVRLRMISDVPIGVFLSGGIDSSTNVALFSRYSRDVKTFSIGYKDAPEYNELKYAGKVAKKFNTKHHEIMIDEKEFIGFLEELVYYQDEPIADPVCVPVYFLSKLAKESGVTVCQVGEGADELFCGYPSWIKFLKVEKLLNSYLNFLPAKGCLYKSITPMFDFTNSSNSRVLEILRRWSRDETIFWGGAEAYSERMKGIILSKKFQEKYKDLSSFEVIENYYNQFMEHNLNNSYLSWMCYLDLNLRLPELLLMRVDKMSMIVSLEARVPFLDHKLVEFAMSISQKRKIDGYITKYIYKKSIEKILPEEIIYRPKQGFSIPLEEWMMTGYGKFAVGKIREFNDRSDLFDREGIEKLINKNSGFLLWCILNFILWYERWIEK